MRVEEYDDAKSIGVEEFRKMVPGRKGRPMTADTVREWCRVGYGETRLRPRHVRVGGHLRFMKSWVREFLAGRVAAGAMPPPPKGPTERQRAASHRRAEKALDRMGVK
jgi:hypothetical protein